MSACSGITIRLGLVETVKHWSRYLPHKAAFIGGGQCVTYRDLFHGAMSVAARLSKIQPREGVPVGLLTERKLPFVQGLLAILANGKSAAILNPVWPDVLLAQTLRDSGATSIVVDSKQVWQRFAERGVTANPLIIDDNVLNERPESEVPFVTSGRDAASEWGIIYSSGTTSQPKGIVRTDFSILTELLGWALELPITREDTFYIGRPLFYTGGLVLAGASLLVGGTVCAPEEHKVAIISFAPRNDASQFSFLFAGPNTRTCAFLWKKYLTKIPGESHSHHGSTHQR